MHERLVATGDLGSDPRWPHLTSAIGGLDIGGILGVPIRLGGITVGSLNTFSSEPHDWDRSEVAAIKAYAAIVEELLASAVLAQQRNTIVDQLTKALDSRVVIERGIGVTMATFDVDAVEAFDVLRRRKRAGERFPKWRLRSSPNAASRAMATTLRHIEGLTTRRAGNCLRMFRRTVVDDEPVDREQVVRATDSYFDPSRLVALAAGLFLVLLGALVLIDTGWADFPSSPVTTVFGFTQTPLLGVIDIGVGLLLLIGAADWDRSVAIFTGALMLMGGIILLVAGDRLPASLQANDGYGWMAVIVGGLVLVVALMFSSVRSHRVVHRERLVRGY